MKAVKNNTNKTNAFYEPARLRSRKKTICQIICQKEYDRGNTYFLKDPLSPQKTSANSTFKFNENSVIFPSLLSPLVPLQHLRGGLALDLLPLPPHLLELNPDLVERLGDDGDEHVLDQPGDEEDHRREIQGSLPVLNRVARPGIQIIPCLITDSSRKCISAILTFKIFCYFLHFNREMMVFVITCT